MANMNELCDECYKEYVTEYINSEKFWNLMHDVSMGELHVLTAIEKIKEKLNLNEE